MLSRIGCVVLTVIVSFLAVPGTDSRAGLGQRATEAATPATQTAIDKVARALREYSRIGFPYTRHHLAMASVGSFRAEPVRK